MSLRIVPDQINRLMERIEAVGKIVEHKTESVDETAAVIDVEARSRTSRSCVIDCARCSDRQRKREKHRGSRGGAFQDTVRAGQPSGERKVLANETQKVS